MSAGKRWVGRRLRECGKPGAYRNEASPRDDDGGRVRSEGVKVTLATRSTKYSEDRENTARAFARRHLAYRDS